MQPTAPREHRILLDHLQLAAVTARLVGTSSGPQRPFAAMTGVPGLIACSDTVRARSVLEPESAMRRLTRQQARTPLVTPLQRGQLYRVVQRTRLERGLPEIRRTWGSGLRALLAEPQHIVPRQQS